jgi:hypothetical protein
MRRGGSGVSSRTRRARVASVSAASWEVIMAAGSVRYSIATGLGLLVAGCGGDSPPGRPTRQSLRSCRAPWRSSSNRAARAQRPSRSRSPTSLLGRSPASRSARSPTEAAARHGCTRPSTRPSRLRRPRSTRPAGRVRRADVHQQGVIALRLAGPRASDPGVEAAPGDAQGAAQSPHAELGPVGGGEVELHFWSSAKYAKAFFKMSRSSVTARNRWWS